MWKNRVAWAVMVLAALGLYLFENNTGTRALLLSLAILPWTSALFLYLPRYTAVVSLTLPERVPRGGRAEGALAVENRGAFPLLQAEVRLNVRNLLTGETAALPFSFAAGGRETRTLPFSLQAAHCGMLELTVDRVTLTGALGLLRRKLPAAVTCTLAVAPEAYPVEIALAETADFLTDSQTYSAQRPGYDPSETFRIRPYVPGDPIRQIHWKLSQKTDTMLVRDFGLPAVNRVLLLLETTPLSDGGANADISPADMDALLDLLFSVSSELLAMEIPHTVGWYDPAADAFTSREIAAREDLDPLLGELLKIPVSAGETTVAGAYGRGHPCCAYAHVALFTTYIPPDVAVLLHGNRVTALLPEGRAASSASAGPAPEVIVFPLESLREGTMQIVL